MRPPIPPQPPGALPLLGHAIPFLRHRLDFLEQARESGPLVTVRFGPRQAFLVTDPALLRRILTQDADHFDRGIHFDKARAVAGNGIVTSTGAFHRRQRKLMLPAFHSSHIKVYADWMGTLAREHTDTWPDTGQLALDQEINALGIAIVAKCLFSTDLNTRAVTEVLRVLPTVLDGIAVRAVDPTGLWEKLPTPGNRRYARAARRLDDIIGDVISGHRKNGRRSQDLLSLLVHAQDKDTGEVMTDRQIRDEVVSLMMAGSETVARTLAWACYLLTTHPDHQHQLHEELDRTLAGRTAGYDDLPALNYTRRVITEALRLYSPAYLLSRTAMHDTELAGYRVPAGSMVLYSFHAIHRDPELFTHPQRFDPDRWLPERSADRTTAAFFPFGLGRHGCIGEGFAWAEAVILLSTIAGRFTLRPAPRARIRPAAGFVLHPDHLPVTLQRRRR